jgi:hypothetical protein
MVSHIWQKRTGVPLRTPVCRIKDGLIAARAIRGQESQTAGYPTIAL